MSGSLDRQRILDLFDEFSEELRFTRIRAQDLLKWAFRKRNG